jgi:citrate synthase
LLGRCGENLPPATLPFDRVKAILPFAAAVDPLRHDHNTFSVVRRMRMLMASLIEALPERSARLNDVEHAFAARLWSRLSSNPPEPELLTALNAALILAADADVTSPTTIAARMAASVRADIYSVITAGLHCSGGSVQTASALAVEGYLKILDGEDSLSVAVGEKLRQGEMLPGFGHRRFPGGDPRARVLLDMLLQSHSGSARVSRLAEFLELQKERGIAPPNIGFAIAALAYVGGLDRGAGDLVFSIARTAGWGAHAIEQYHSDQDLGRPPSIYVGRLPLAEA